MAGVATGSGEEITPSEGAKISSARSDQDPQHESDISKLYTAVMESKWNEVVGIYKKNKSVPTMINQVGDTILHLAILMGDQDDVIELIKLMEKQLKGVMENILRTENDWGNTPLHQAAFMGFHRVCSLMAKRYFTTDKGLVLPRNKQGETPLHVAVLHGQTTAFFALQLVIEEKDPSFQQKVKEERPDIIDRKNGGNTILHSAIFREHFDLALEITEIYPHIVHAMNEKGESALHILANKPSAFKSGTYLGPLDGIIYHSVPLGGQPKYSAYKEKARQDDHEEPDALWTNGEDDKSKRIKDIEIEIPAPWTNDDDDRPKHNIDVEIIEDGVKQRGHADQENTVIQIQGIPPGSPNQQRYPECHKSFFKIFIEVLNVLVILLLSIGNVKEIIEMKKKNSNAHKIMKRLVSKTKGCQFESDGGKPKELNYTSEAEKLRQEHRDSVREKNEKQSQQQQNSEPPEKASPFLVAAKRGVKEMVKEILKISPVAAFDVDSKGKSIILLAAEHRQTRIYKHMLTTPIVKSRKKAKVMKEALLKRVDDQGNSALHWAARLDQKQHPWSIPGASLQMQSEIKWYKHVEKSMGPGLHYNFEGKTAQDIFTETHEELIKDAREWLKSTSESCSVVAALVAAVAYTSATSVPGGNQSTGFPVFESQPAFKVFAMSSLVAFYLSVAALILFLSILTSRFHESDFETGLPRKLIWGITTLFLSITANLVSFCAGHFYIIHDELKSRVYYLYGVLSLPFVAFFFFSHARLYLDLIKGWFSREPERYGEQRYL